MEVKDDLRLGPLPVTGVTLSFIRVLPMVPIYLRWPMDSAYHNIAHAETHQLPKLVGLRAVLYKACFVPFVRHACLRQLEKYDWLSWKVPPCPNEDSQLYLSSCRRL